MAALRSCGKWAQQTHVSMNSVNEPQHLLIGCDHVAKMLSRMYMQGWQNKSKINIQILNVQRWSQHSTRPPSGFLTNVDLHCLSNHSVTGRVLWQSICLSLVYPIRSGFSFLYHYSVCVMYMRVSREFNFWPHLLKRQSYWRICSRQLLVCFVTHMKRGHQWIPCHQLAFRFPKHRFKEVFREHSPMAPFWSVRALNVALKMDK